MTVSRAAARFEMAHRADRLRAGEPIELPSGDLLLVVERALTELHGHGRWRSAYLQRVPHALVVRRADGVVDVLAIDGGPISWSALGGVLPAWAQAPGRPPAGR